MNDVIYILKKYQIVRFTICYNSWFTLWYEEEIEQNHTAQRSTLKKTVHIYLLKYIQKSWIMKAKAFVNAIYRQFW